MWIEQKVYTLKVEKGGDVKLEDILNDIYLRVNENLTDIKIEKLFLKHSDPEFEKNLLILKGWSLLKKVVPITGELKIKEQPIKISFNSETLGDLEIIEIENPLVQFDDKKIEDSDVENFNTKIIELSQLKPVDEKVEEDVIPHTETSTDIVPIVNKKYENGKSRYLNNGYSEFKDGNFKLLIKKDAEKTIALFYKIVSEDEIVPYTNVTQESENNFIFLKENEGVIYNGKLENDILKVEPVLE